MKIVTLNTHSKPDISGRKNAEIIAKAIETIRPEVVCLQEVNQTITSEKSSFETPLGAFYMKQDNFGLMIKEHLDKTNYNYEYVWCGFKNAYGKYEEGIGILSALPIDYAEAFFISKIRDITDYRTRMAVGIECGRNKFYSVHTGKWNDTSDSFENQIELLLSKIDNGWICGDFNCPPECEKYNILNESLYDSYTEAEIKDEGFTVRDSIDGWKENYHKMRIDYIFSTSKKNIKKCETIFNNKTFPIVSDHFGVIAEI